MAEEPDWEISVYPEDNIFSSFLVGTARVDLPEEFFGQWEDNHLGDPQGSIGIYLSGVKAGQKIKVTLLESPYWEESTFSATLKKRANDLHIHPKVIYNFDALSRLNQAKPLNVKMRLEVDGEDLGTQVATVTLRPINDCLFAVIEEDEDGEVYEYDCAWLFAAYVNENHPWVDRVLKEALETGIVSSFDGYQSGDADQVVLQIFAIWNTMQRRGLKYSDITTTAASDETVYSQHVRLFDESLNAAQANCVDGSVLLAAVLRKIGLYPYLVLVPGHMYLAVDLDDETTIGIETTLMGSANLPKNPKISIADSLSSTDAKEAQNMESWESFEAAVAMGTEALEEDIHEIDGEHLQYQLIDITLAREVGILPITSSRLD